MQFLPFTLVQTFCLEHFMLSGINVLLGNIIRFSYFPSEDRKVSINFEFSSTIIPWVRSELGQGQKFISFC